MPEWIGSLLFLGAIGLSAAKLSDDFGRRGELGYLMLITLIAVYAAAIGLAYV